MKNYTSPEMTHEMLSFLPIFFGVVAFFATTAWIVFIVLELLENREDKSMRGAKIRINNKSMGICIQAYPDRNRSEGLILTLAVGVSTMSEALITDSSELITINSLDALAIYKKNKHKKSDN